MILSLQCKFETGWNLTFFVSFAVTGIRDFWRFGNVDALDSIEEIMQVPIVIQL